MHQAKFTGAWMGRGISGTGYPNVGRKIPCWGMGRKGGEALEWLSAGLGRDGFLRANSKRKETSSK